MENDVTRILQNVDNVTENFVFNSFQGFGAFADTLWTLMAITYIAFIGYKITISGNFDIASLLGEFGKILLILVVVTQWDFFGQAFYDIVIQTPSDMGGLLVQSNALIEGDASNYQMTGRENLGQFWTSGMDVVAKLQQIAGTGWGANIGILFLSIVVWIGVAALTIAALLLLILAQLAVAIFMAIAPLFFLFAMFQSTRPFFEGWLRMTMNYALIPLFVFAILSLILSMINQPLALLSNVKDKSLLFNMVSPIILITIVGTVILTQVMQMAAGVAGGFALATGQLISRAMSPATNLARNTYTRTLGQKSHFARKLSDRNELRYLNKNQPLQQQLAAARGGNSQTARHRPAGGGGRGPRGGGGGGNLAGTPTGARS